jgi:hypothetical protein
MWEFLLLILTLVAIAATILLFVIANKLTDGRCWVVTKKIAKWGVGIPAALFGLAIVATVIVDNWERIQQPLAYVGVVLAYVAVILVLLLGAGAFFMIIRHGIVRPFLEGLRGRQPR